MSDYEINDAWRRYQEATRAVTDLGVPRTIGDFAAQKGAQQQLQMAHAHLLAVLDKPADRRVWIDAAPRKYGYANAYCSVVILAPKPDSKGVVRWTIVDTPPVVRHESGKSVTNGSFVPPVGIALAYQWSIRTGIPAVKTRIGSKVEEE